MDRYRTPGLYFEWQDAPRPAIGAVRSDIAGFVGIAERGPLHRPMKIESWPQFQSIFGGHIADSYLAFAAEGFFANGGTTCWVVRVADPAAARCSRCVLHKNLHLCASSPGSWGNRLRVLLRPMGNGRFTFVVTLANVGQEVWPDLSFDRSDRRFVEKIINGDGGSGLIRYEGGEIGADVVQSEEKWFGTSSRDAFDTPGDDGLLTLTAEHFSGSGPPPDDPGDRTSVNLTPIPYGLRALESVDEVSIVAIPDLVWQPGDKAPKFRPQPPTCTRLEGPPNADVPYELDRPRRPAFDSEAVLQLQAHLVMHCENLKDRFAILDTPFAAASPSAIDLVGLPQSKFAALYYPWVLVASPLAADGFAFVPPSGHVAGVYAGCDRRVGVHKPPANEPLEGVADLAYHVDDLEHARLNDRSVNVIRSFPGRGIRVVGARTLAAPDDSQWKYVSVRRLLTMVEESIDESTQWVVFEPNNPESWREVDRVIRSFLDDLWRRGMLDGATAEAAYSVRCDQTTNPPEAIENGRMTCEVGVQPPWPAEFVVVRIGRTASGTQVDETHGGVDA
ncbi:MAG: phage tail sheath family protein [Deltaproteobacteria bacterium]|nr:phage tail sheath family protein [Deltaproteobacteria bacterium]